MVISEYAHQRLNTAGMLHHHRVVSEIPFYNPEAARIMKQKMPPRKGNCHSISVAKF
jgi:hypothetical protein